MTDADLGKLMDRVSDGKAAEKMLDLMADLVTKDRKRVEERVFAQIEKQGFIEPHLAVQAWIELHALTQLPKRLRRQARDGKVAGQKVEERKPTDRGPEYVPHLIP